MFPKETQQEQHSRPGVFDLAELLNQGEAVDTDVIEEEEEAPAAEEPKEDPKPKPEPKPNVEEPVDEDESTIEEEEQRANPDESPTVYAELLQNYIEDGDWEDAIVEIDGEEVKLSDLKSVDKETFLQIKSTQRDIQRENLEKRYIDTDGLDETDLELIKLKKSGGDWTPLLKEEAQVLHPLKGLDLEDEGTQLWILSEKYRSQGMDPEAIKTQLEFDKKNFKLDEKSKKVIEDINSAFDRMVADENQKKQQEIQAAQEKRKELTKNLKETYKGMQLSDSAIKRYVETATKDTGKGRTKLDSIIESYKEDPEKLARLAYFLEDEKGFLEFNGAKQKNKQSLRTIKLISETNRKTKDIAKNQEDDDVNTDPWSKMTFKPPQAK